MPAHSNEALYHEALRYIPGGTSRLHYHFAPYPIYARSASGCRLVDHDGVERLDFLNNMTALIHGHADPAIVAAISDQLAAGTVWSEPGAAEVALARAMVERVGSVEQIRFANSGTEAVMLAVKMARAFTGRNTIAKFEGAYHGYYDYVQVSFGGTPANWGPEEAPASVPTTAGLPPSILDQVAVIQYNDPGQVDRLVARRGNDLAALIVDPLSVRMGAPRPAPGFLEYLTEVTCRHGIVLIYDEVISFRVGFGGAQSRYGGVPDLTTFGKVIGGGLPVGAVGGRREIMSLLDPDRVDTKVLSGGTFSANPLTMVAGKAALDRYDAAAVERLNRLGDRLRTAGNAAFRAAGVTGQITGDGSLFRILLTDEPVTNYRSSVRRAAPTAAMLALHANLLREGIIVGKTGLGCLSTPMTEAEVDRFTTALARALASS
ncbi:MAG: aspartate aminotransferase family protein [Gemmatimonadetes bacterium]|nr:aspartate aminotransferase family protein [Gemmatimonadota bacterium]